MTIIAMFIYKNHQHHTSNHYFYKKDEETKSCKEHKIHILLYRMQKKVSLQKKSQQKHETSSYLKKYVFSLIIAFVGFTVTSFTITTQQTKPTCANSKSCKSDLIEKIENNTIGTFAGKIVHPPKIDQTPGLTDLSVLG